MHQKVFNAKILIDIYSIYLGSTASGVGRWVLTHKNK